MNAIDPDAARERSKPSSDADAAVEQSMGGLLRPHVGSFAAVVVLQVIGAVAGLAPLLAVVELGRTLLASGPVDHDHVWDVVVLGAVGLFVRLVFTAASSGVGHILYGRVQLTFRRRLAARLGRVPIGRLSRRRTGEPAKVVGEDVSAVHPFIAHTPGELVSAFGCGSAAVVDGHRRETPRRAVRAGAAGRGAAHRAAARAREAAAAGGPRPGVRTGRVPAW
ncbi:hypothetical protein [Streptomyces sp. NPDC051677]|uniref:hypothetical protein n=1 Tax=Streptomyces sp. NPDC051677 TaxID=3365669 RepID=UPI0037CE1FD7